MTKDQEIKHLKAQLVWFKGESFASKTVLMIQDRILMLEKELSNPQQKVLDIPS